MRRNKPFIILFLGITALCLSSCIKNLEDEGIYVTTNCHGILLDQRSQQPLQNITIVTTNGDIILQTVYSDSTGSFTIPISASQINSGYYISIQPDSLYNTLDIPLDNMKPGQQNYELGSIFIQGPAIPTITTDTVTDITPFTAICVGTIVDNGNSSITEYGFVYDTLPYPTVNNYKVYANGDTSTFSSTIELQPGTTYYIRAYARNGIGVGYGQQLSFTTLSALPTITAPTIATLSSTSATCTATIQNEGSAIVTQHGVCWSTQPNPTTNNSHTEQGYGSGTFTSTLNNLQPSTTYYLRAYAQNSYGTAYSTQRTLTTTSAMPTVSTFPATSITSSSAISGGNILRDGGLPILRRGVCFSTSPVPTIEGNHTTDGSGNGQFVSNLTSLLPATTYYIRAYATNAAGTAYGEQYIFVTQ